MHEALLSESKSLFVLKMAINGQEFVPFNGFRMDFEIDFNHPAIELMSNACCLISHHKVLEVISRLKNFSAFMRDIEYLQSQNSSTWR